MDPKNSELYLWRLDESSIFWWMIDWVYFLDGLFWFIGISALFSCGVVFNVYRSLSLFLSV